MGPSGRLHDRLDSAGALLGQHRVDVAGRLKHTEAGRGVSLWIDVDDEGLDATVGGCRCQAQDDRGLADTALLVHYSNRGHRGNLIQPVRSAVCSS